MTLIDRVSLRPEAGPSFARKAVRALAAAGLVAGIGYLVSQSPDPLAASPERPATSEVDRDLELGVEALAGGRTYVVILDHAALPEGWRERPLEERTRLVGNYVSGRLAERGVFGIAPQYGQVLRGIAADGALPMAHSVEMLQVTGPGGPGLAHLCVAIPADPAAAEGVVSGLVGSASALKASEISETQWRRFVAAHEVFHCLDFQERGVVWRQARRFGLLDAPPEAPSELERYADVAAAAWTFGTGPEAAAAVRAAADLRALAVARHVVEHRVLSFTHWTTPALDALADRLERGEGVGATGVAGAAALARTAVADARGDGEALLAALPRLNNVTERPAGVPLERVGAELRRLGAPESLAARVELAVARQGGLERQLPEPGSTGAGILAMSAMAGDMPVRGQPDERSPEGVGLSGADVRPMAVPEGLVMDSVTGLLVFSEDLPLLRTVVAARERALATAADAGVTPVDPQSGLTLATEKDLTVVRGAQAALAGTPHGLERDAKTGLLLGKGDRVLLDAVSAAQDRVLSAEADAGRAPVEPRTGLALATSADLVAVRTVQAALSGASASLERDRERGLLQGKGDGASLDAVRSESSGSSTELHALGAALRALDLVGREGVLSARFQTWGMPMDPLAQEEMRIRHAFQQEMLRCNSLQAGANVMANIFAGPTNGLAWSLGQMGGGLTAEMCRIRAQQNAEAAMMRLRELAHQRELAARQQKMGAPGPSVGKDGGKKALERPVWEAQR